MENNNSPNYKLTYFNYRGYGESIRYIFKLAKVEFEDCRIEWDDKWENELKKQKPWGKLPVLEFEDKVLSESVAICRFLAREFGLVGANEFESAKCDEAVDAMVELKTKCTPLFFESDPVKLAEIKDKLINETFPPFFHKLSEKISANENGWIVGSNITWADIYIFHIFEYLESSLGENIVAKYPTLKSYNEKIKQIPQIESWIHDRPETSF